MQELERALRLMLEAHAGQVDKAGAPYVLHPLRLMFRLQTTDERVVALLHDVVEDADVTLDFLRSEGFREEVVEAIAGLTRGPQETYENFIDRLSSNALARKVKIEDLKDNMDLTRLTRVNDSDLQRLRKYHTALKQLQLLP
jgi:(p)ppGpp synthase/HD superfamily hydrolase